MRVHVRITIDGEKFILAEKIADYRTASLAQAEYRGAGVKCRKWPVPEEKVYYLWVGPKLKRKPRTLPGEKIKRIKSNRIGRRTA